MSFHLSSINPHPPVFATNNATTNGALLNPPTPMMVLAHTADHAAQAHGLSDSARQRLHSFAVQTSPDAASIWIYAANLQCLAHIEDFSDDLGFMNGRLDTMTELIRREFRLNKAQEAMIRKLMRRFIATSRTAYRTLANRTKTYISGYPAQFSLDLYNTDNTVELIVNQFVTRESHQVRGAFRKLVFGETIAGKTLAEASERISIATSADAGSPPERWFQAHIAQLRLISYDCIVAIRAAEEAAAQATASTSSSSKKRTRSDTGFWKAVDDTFNALTRAHGVNYLNNPKWTRWEDEVIGADEALFVGVNQFPGEQPSRFLDED